MVEPLGRFVATNSAGGIKWLQACTAQLLVGVSVGSCSFPDYGFSPAVAGSGGTAAAASAPGGAGGASGGSAGVVVGGVGGAGASGSGMSGADPGSAGEAGSGEAGAPGCEAPGPAVLPVSCRNGAHDGDETDVDCGGAVCAPCVHGEACAASRDCISTECTANACVPLVQLETQAIVRTRDTYTLQFRFRLHYLSTIPQKLKAFSLRYYFTRGGRRRAAGADLTTSGFE